jgi:hypothetical protein
MDLIDQIKTAVSEDRYVVSVHARQRLAERKVKLWQIETGLETASIEEVRPDSVPNPSIVVEEVLPDGSTVVVVWSWLTMANQAKLVTVYFRD